MQQIKSKKIELNLNSDFYNETCVNQAIKDFSHLCIISSKEENNNYVISFDRINEEENDLRFISLEFCNYVIGLMKTGGLV